MAWDAMPYKAREGCLPQRYTQRQEGDRGTGGACRQDVLCSARGWLHGCRCGPRCGSSTLRPRTTTSTTSESVMMSDEGRAWRGGAGTSCQAPALRACMHACRVARTLQPNIRLGVLTPEPRLIRPRMWEAHCLMSQAGWMLHLARRGNWLARADRACMHACGVVWHVLTCAGRARWRGSWWAR